MINTPHVGSGHGLSMLFHADALPLGTKLSEFEITGLLGVGGFGMVYEAFDHSLQRMVAIKEYMPSALAGRSQGPNLTCRSTGDEDALRAGLVSFIAEARLLAQFDHPSLVKVYRFWEANNTAYMVMPLYKGITLKHARNQAQSPPTEAWLRPMLWAVLGGLKYLHSHNVVHRDISPDNIFLQEVGPPVLLDLGAARRAIGESSQKHTAILKVNYAPIEQYADASDLPQGPWTDLYALAAVVHGALCNAQPLPATFRVVRDRLPTFASVAKTVESIFGQAYTASFVQAFGHALEIQPQDRPQSVQAFIDEIGLAAPTGPQTMSWRGLPAVGHAAAIVDSEARTVYQAPSIAVTTVDAPVTDDAAPELISAYGVLEQESPLLAPHPEPQPALVGAKAPVEAAISGVAADSVGRADAIDRVRKPKAAKQRSASANADSSAAAPASASKVKTAVIATVCAVALLAGAVLWNAKGKQSVPQVSQTEPLAPEPASPGAAAKPANLPSQQSALQSAPAPTTALPTAPTTAPATSPKSALTPAATPAQAGALSSHGEGLPQKPKSPVKGPEGSASSAEVGGKVLADGRSAPPKTTPTGSTTKAATGASAGIYTTTPGVAQPAATTPANPPAAPRTTAARDRPGPTEICAEKNFLVRPMCIHLECEKPEFAQLGFCVENRQRLKEQARPNDR